MSPLTIKAGDIVDIVFPASSCTKDQVEKIKNYTRGVMNLAPRILLEDELVPSSDIANNEFPLSDSKTRGDQLYKALSSDSKIIWCARGGYGSGDLLPFLDKLKPVKQNKLFIGFSDTTSISIFLQQEWGWYTIYGPVLQQLAQKEISADAEKELHNLIFTNKSSYDYRVKPLNAVSNDAVRSEITGGCLSVLLGHSGGGYEINFTNKILFLEDEGECGERLDRYFRQVVEIILKTQNYPKSIILGNFTKDNIHGTTENVDIAVSRFLEKVSNFNLTIPIFMVENLDLGHGANMRPLPLGGKAKISFKEGCLLRVSL